MKKLLSILLALAIVVSCLTMVTFAANESQTSVANKSIFIDFENESDVSTYFDNSVGGTIEYAANNGVDQSGALKFHLGDQNWNSPVLKTAYTKQVFSKAGRYAVSFDIYFEKLPSSGSTNISYIFRFTGGTGNKFYLTANCNATLGAWKHVEVFIDADEDIVQKDALRFCFDGGVGKGSVFYLDNFKIICEESDTEIKENYAFIDFENETDKTNYFDEQSCTLSYAEGKGIGQSSALKVVGTYNWSSPVLKTTPTAQVFTQPGTYNVSFDVYFEVLPEKATTFGYIFRHSNGNTGHLGYSMNISKTTGVWQHIVGSFTVDEATLAKGSLRFCFDGGIGTGSTYYIDNLEISYRETNTEIKENYAFIDFEYESDLTNYIEQFASTHTYANNGGVDYSGALKFEGDANANWASPVLKTAATTQVFTKPGKYTVSFDICFEKLPADPTKNLAFIFRYDKNSSGSSNTGHLGFANSANPTVGVWKHLEGSFVVDAETLANSNLRFCFDNGVGNGSVYYLDNLKIVYNPPQTGISITSTTDITGVAYSRTDAKLTADMAVDNVITREYTVYNLSNNPVHFIMMHQGGVDDRIGWDNVMGSNGYVETTIPALGKYTYTLEILLDDQGMVKYYVDNDGTTEGACPLENVYLRYEINGYVNNVSAGTTLYIESHNENDVIMDTSWVQSNFGVYSGAGLYGDVYPDYSVENKIEGADLQIGSSLTVNYFATVRDGIVPTLRVTRGDDVRVIDGTLEGEIYKFAYTGVNAQCMADNLYAELLYGDAVIAIKDNYSVKQYAINVYTDTEKLASDELKALLADMLHYGAEVQKYIGYKTDNLATKDIDWTASNHTLPSLEGDASVIREADQTGDAAHKVTSVGLNISYVNKIYFRLGFTDLDNVEIKLTRNDAEIEYTTAVKNDIIIYSDAINATGFGDKYTITITNNETGAENTVSYNVNAYIAAKQNGNERISSLVKALNDYGKSAQAYALLNQQ